MESYENSATILPVSCCLSFFSDLDQEECKMTILS